ncbi:MAG: site-specific integrase [Planctomycetes bacterium]|nr:site-specific integrase [Planctomycetota bacterium]
MSENVKAKKDARSAFGQVYQDWKSKRWCIRYPDPLRRPEPGKRAPYIARNVSANRKDAEDLLDDVYKSVLAGTYAAPLKAAAKVKAAEEPAPALTLVGAIDAYLVAKEAEGKAGNTIRGYRGIRERIASSDLGSRAVTAITPTQVESYLLWRRERLWRAKRKKGAKKSDRPLVEQREKGAPSNSTLARDLALIAASLNRLVRLRELAENPAARVKKPRESKRTRVALSKDEARNLIGACDPWIRPLVVAALYTGARRGELMALRWGSVNFDAGTIDLYRSKTRNASRLPMHPALAAELKSFRERVAKRRKHVPAAEDPIFVCGRGGARWDFRKRWEDALAGAGLTGRPGLVFHTLRHTFAVHYLERGAVTDLQGMLGHASLATTQVYAKMVDTRTRESVEALDFGAPPAAPTTRLQEKMRRSSVGAGPGASPEGARSAGKESAQAAAG